MSHETRTDFSGKPAEPDPNKLQGIRKYILATRPSFLLATVVPVLIGLASVSMQGLPINFQAALMALLTAVLIHAGVNVLNDYYDALNGTDEMNKQRLFPFTGGSRFIQNGLLTNSQTALYGWQLLVSGALSGSYLALSHGHDLLWLGAIGLLLGWGYSAPPLQLNSRGLGEITVCLGFGVLIPAGTAFAQQGEYALWPMVAGIPYGLLITNLLYINQFPDRVADEACGKHHWVVRLGESAAPWGYVVIGLMSYAWLLLAVVAGWLPVVSLAGIITLPLTLLATQSLFRNRYHPEKLAPAIRFTLIAAILQGIVVSTALFVY